MTIKAAIRVARAERMTRDLGHTDILDALRHAEEMRSALRVIHTWAKVEGEDLDHRQVMKLAAKALHMVDNASVSRPREAASETPPPAPRSA